MKVSLGAGIIAIVASLLSIPNLASNSNIAPESEMQPPAWVLNEHAKKTTEQSGLAVFAKDIVFEKTDLNGDGHIDWIVYSTINCGSAGCTADAYAFINNQYCYVGWTRYGDAPGVFLNKYTNLKCQTKNVPLKLPL